MKDEEFVKLRFWLDAELTMIRVFLAIIIGLIADNMFAWTLVIIYVAVSILYAGARINYVERKHRGYLRLPKI